MNDYSKTTITIESHKADEMLIALWDRAWSDTRERRMEIQTEGGPITQDKVANITAIALNAFEDQLRAEFGLKPLSEKEVR